MLLLMGGSRNHNFIIPRPMKKSKGNMDENAVNRPSGSTADFLPGACRDESSERPVAGVPS
jgi:hypothetical protein